ncbi:type II secretion system major pseudopilin GspG [Stakelama pacifica]|uniref:Type II secretion system core protein G n=1 Tax=Stakelama pacifica TaxID=517720 RepID=A0A4R6FEC3_9SPHN|nr:type II secretion system major pseudopilin GspG [Stakelama pacifica]MAX01131.1 type II secretion system protein GspG [Sphingomonas sp.]TDN79050.1 type II secretion system protein G (GspG) [Stakelama pacifica]GGO98749.1 type II secretion system protein G [Stakelama pacifica]
MRIVSKQNCYTVAARGDCRKRRPIAHGETGLTLVEMIVVLAIIAIVGALIVTNVISRPDEARVTVAKTDIKTISSALKMYRLDNGDYPTEQQGLKALVEKPTTPPVPRNWAPDGYLGEMPQDPWGNPYVYKTGGPGGFTIVSLGKDGKPGGEGIDADIDGKRE